MLLGRVGSAERVDHRSHAERGLDEQPTIHEGVAARAMEKKGIISDHCELNRQIKSDNALLRELGCADDAGVKAVQIEITAMGASLHKLSRLADPHEADSSVRQQLRLAPLRAEKEASYKHQSCETTPPAR